MKKKLLVATLTAVMAFGTISLSGCESATDNTGTLAESADEAFAKEMTETLAYDESLNDPDTLFRGAGSDSDDYYAAACRQRKNPPGISDAHERFQLCTGYCKWIYFYLQIRQNDRSGNQHRDTA